MVKNFEEAQPPFCSWKEVAACFISVFAISLRLYIAGVTRYTGEDFFITLRYARNIAEGNGFVYNVGQHVLGTTTPLYTLLLALFLWLHLPAILLGKWVNIGADGLTCWLLFQIASRLRVPTAGLAAAMLYAVGVTPISISVSGMETGLVTCVGMTAIYAFICANTLWLWIWTAVLFLLRIDGLVLGGTLLIAQLWQQRRVDWRGVMLAACITLPWLVFACFYFGTPLPASVVAKLTVYRATMGHNVVLSAFRTQFAGGIFQGLLTVLFLIGIGESLFKRRWQLTVPLFWLIVYYGTMLISTVPAFSWYFLPPWPLYLLTAMMGGAFLIHLARMPKSVAPWRSVTERGLIVGLAILGLWHLPSVISEVRRPQQEEEAVLLPTGLWFREHAMPHESILLEPIGTIGYYSNRPILDMIGLVTPEVLPCYTTHSPLFCMVSRFHPMWLCLRPREANRLQQEAPGILSHDYHLVRTVSWNGSRSPVFLIFQRR